MATTSHRPAQPWEMSFLSSAAIVPGWNPEICVFCPPVTMSQVSLSQQVSELEATSKSIQFHPAFTFYI